MFEFSLDYYKECKCAIIRSLNYPFTSKRPAIVFIITLLSAFFANAHSEVNDSVVVSSQVRSRIDFKVNRTELETRYHGNDTLLDKVLAEIDSMVLDPHKQVRHITIVGTASPEGPLQGNIRLATNRAKTLTDILQNRYSFPDSLYATSTIPEDWDGMRRMLIDDGSIPYSQTVINFIDNTGHLAPDAREYQLKRLDGGKPYSSMRDNVLPFLRRASVVVDYDSARLRPRPQLSSLTPIAPDIKRLHPILPSTLRMRPAGTTASPRRRFAAIKTNLLWDAALCANLGLELELWPRWSLDVPVWYSPYDITGRWRIRLLATQPEVRYWPREAGTGHYLGVHTTVAGFNISTNGDYRYQDPNHAAFGAGIGYGYTFHLDKNRRWSLEAQIGAGFISYKWIKYHNTGRNGAEISRGKGTYWGVTRAGISISYKFYMERKERRWMKW